VAASKATALIQLWDQKWRAQKLTLSLQATAEQKTAQAQATLHALQGILHDSLSASHHFEWSELKTPFTARMPPEPKIQAIPERPTSPKDPGEEPNERDEKYRPGWLSLFFPSMKRKAHERFEQDHFEWEKAVKALERYPALLKEWEEETRRVREQNDRLQTKWKSEIAAWKKRKRQHETDQEARVSAFKEAVASGERSAVEEFFSIVLERSDYPEYFPREFAIAFNPVTKILVCDYQLPSPGALPTLKEVTYVKSRKALVEKHLSKKESEAMYDSVVYQTCLRTIHELFSADEFGVLDLVTFNGWVRDVDRGTGKDINPCILSLQVSRQVFEEIDLPRVDPKACFKTLKGVGSTKLHALAPVAPLLQLDIEDNRFVEARNIANRLSEGTNLAAMDWEDFEHLIRELFEAEFAERGAVVKITQASRDRGVDAVVFDPDPIRGGKIILQAKRYTNTVGADAVRDLYGTVVKEGANKGILITTSDFGPDSYEYVKGLPITLLSGGNLVHLLAKHGHKARIDLAEAKRIQAEKDAAARR
jgi:restriction system protein